MTGKDRDEINRIANLLAEELLIISDDEVLEDFKAAYKSDVTQYATDMKLTFAKVVISTNKQKLMSAKAAVASRSIRSMDTSVVSISEARKKLRRLLDNPEYMGKLTMAARKESELSDADVISMLGDFEELGVPFPRDGQKED